MVSASSSILEDTGSIPVTLAGEERTPRRSSPRPAHLLPKDSIDMAGNATDARKRAEEALRNAKKNDPSGKSASTQTLQAAYDAARTTELEQSGQNEQARSWF